MVAYSFKRQFIQPIQSRTKQQTIRGHRKRHARPGEPVQLFYGMRTRQCKKIISDPLCTEVLPVGFHLLKPRWEMLSVGSVTLGSDRADEFARSDGFSCFREMVEFWIENHGRVVFEGVCIRWQDADAF